MIINFDDFNSLPQQVAENKKNIEEMTENITDLQAEMELKQTKLIAGTNITLTDVGNMVRIDATDTDTNVDVKIDGISIVVDKIANIISMNGDYNADTNPFATLNDIDTLGMVKQDKLNSINAGKNIFINTLVGNDVPTINVDGEVIKQINSLVYIEDLADGIYQGKAKYFCYDKTNNKIIDNIGEIHIILQVTTQDINTKLYVAFMNNSGAYNIIIGTTILSMHTGNMQTYSLGDFLSANNIVFDLDSTTPNSVLGGSVGNTIKNLINAKQDILQSGNNIKTINGESLLGSGDITVGGGVETLTNTVIDLSSPTLNESGLYYVVPSDGTINIIAGDGSIYTSAQNGMAIIYNTDTLRLLYFVYGNNGVYHQLSAHYYPVISSGDIDYNIGSPQEKLLSGNNIKTINGESLLGSGDITVGGGSTLYEHKITINSLNLGDAGGVIYNIKGVFTFINNSSTPISSATDIINAVSGQGKIPVNGLVLQLNNTILGRALSFTISSSLSATITYISDSTNNITDSTTGQLTTMNGNVFDDVRQL